MKRIRQTIGNFFDMPKELVEDTVKISIIDNTYLIIENYKQIIDYTENCIKININKLEVIIEGTGLYLSEMTKNELLISGNIYSLTYNKEDLELE